MTKYAIIDEAAGHLVNVVLWDGDLAKWQPPAGTRAELFTNVDLASLLPAPAPASEPVTAEAAVSQYFSPYQISALSRLEMALLQASQPLGANMTALKAWMEAMLVASIDATPRSDWQQPPCSYEAASGEAVAALQP
jgi:hypothetical protein